MGKKEDEELAALIAERLESFILEFSNSRETKEKKRAYICGMVMFLIIYIGNEEGIEYGDAILNHMKKGIKSLIDAIEGRSNEDTLFVGDLIKLYRDLKDVDPQ